MNKREPSFNNIVQKIFEKKKIYQKFLGAKDQNFYFVRFLKLQHKPWRNYATRTFLSLESKLLPLFNLFSTFPCFS